MSAPLRITLLYALFGVVWITVGDLLQFRGGDVSAHGLVLGLAKGFIFVATSAALLYFLVRREVRSRTRAAAELRAVLDTAPVGIVAIDADGTIHRWNNGASIILGWREDEVRGRTIRDVGIVPSDRATTALAPDTLVRSRDGAEVAIRIFRSATDPAGDGSSVLVFRDRRPQIAMESALRQAHKLEAVGRLAGGVAHEFNNILTAILGHALLLLERMDDGDDRRANVLELRRAAERAAGLTRQLLVFSGKHVTRPEPVNLTALVREMRGVAARIAGTGVHIDLQLAEDLWTVRADAAQVQQLIANLVVNAREAMNDDGTLTIATTNFGAQAPRSGADPVPAGELVRLTVSDTGRGMSADTLAHIFEPFFTTKEQGTGLGLAAVYGIVQQCDGHIRVTSQPGQGARFDIFLPRASATAAAPPAPEAPQAAGVSLLVVEDDNSVRELTCRVLRRAGHQVMSARNGFEALSTLSRECGIRLVIADIVMPGMTGFELGDAVRRDYPHLPILFTSGYVGPAADATALPPGTSFLEKPYRPDELLARVDALLTSPTEHG